jgi:cytoskeleton-associated protein 5
MQVEKNAAAGRTPSSLPLSTPPPIAAIPSPKFAPSPVHTKSIGSKPDSNEDDASGETQQAFRSQGDDSRLHSTDQPTDRYQTSGPHPTLPQCSCMHNCICCQCLCHLIVGIIISLPAGTLDALRERMKSIQAAAVGHFDGAQARPLASMNGSNMLHGGTRLDGEPQQQSNIPPMDERALSGLQARMERLKSGSMEPL